MNKPNALEVVQFEFLLPWEITAAIPAALHEEKHVWRQMDGKQNSHLDALEPVCSFVFSRTG